MPRRPGVPKKGLHKGTGQLRVVIEGRHYYCGPYGTREADQAADLLISKYLTRRAEGKRAQEPRSSERPGSVMELLACYFEHADANFRTRQGARSAEYYHVKTMISLAKPLGSLRIDDFTPAALRSLRDDFVAYRRPGEADGWSRGYINDQVARVRRMFSWGVEQGYVDVRILQALREVKALRRGKTSAPELPPIEPVSNDVFLATVKQLPPVLAMLAQVQRLTGMRPGEMVRLRPRDIDRSGECWLVDFGEDHKTAWADKSRRIWIGPKAQAILAPLMATRAPGDYLFPSRAGRPYRVDSYQHAVKKAARKAGVPEWFPYQLRHGRITEAALAGGPLEAQAVGGHSTLDTSAIYIHTQDELAKRAARRSG